MYLPFPSLSSLPVIVVGVVVVMVMGWSVQMFFAPK
jgi:hypothetical protein